MYDVPLRAPLMGFKVLADFYATAVRCINSCQWELESCD